MPDSRKQVRWAYATLSGKTGGDKKFAREVIAGMHGKKMSSLPESKKPKTGFYRRRHEAKE